MPFIWISSVSSYDWTTSAKAFFWSYSIPGQGQRSEEFSRCVVLRRYHGDSADADQVKQCPHKNVTLSSLSIRELISHFCPSGMIRRLVKINETMVMSIKRITQKILLIHSQSISLNHWLDHRRVDWIGYTCIWKRQEGFLNDPIDWDFDIVDLRMVNWCNESMTSLWVESLVDVLHE